MKKLVIGISLSLFVLGSCNMGTTVTPVDYNNNIVGEQTKVVKCMLKLQEGFGAYDMDKCEKERMLIIKQCEESIQTLAKMEAYDNNTDLRDAAKALITFYKDICLNEYKEIIEIFRKGENVDESDALRYSTIESSMEQKEIPLDEKFQAAQKAFSKKYNLPLLENELQKEIDKE